MRRFFVDKTVLVTGHTGFKGSWLCHWLKRLGARVVGYSLPPPGMPNLFTLGHVAAGMTSVDGNVQDLPALRAVFEKHHPDVVFHLAAQALVRRSYREPVDTFSTNVMGTVNVLEACRLCESTRAVVIVTSDKCYENREWLWGYREDEPMGGHDPYSASKGCAELVVAAYRRSYPSKESSPGKGKAPAIASARAGNVIGGGDFAEDRLVPDIIRGIAAGEKIVIRNPYSIRPWQHVLDPLSGYLLLATRLWDEPEAHAEAWNFGPRDELSLPTGELGRRLCSLLGRGILEIADDRPLAAFHEAASLKLDCSKALARLGWRARLRIEDALELTARFYRSYLEAPESLQNLLHQQIDDYESRSG